MTSVPAIDGAVDENVNDLPPAVPVPQKDLDEWRTQLENERSKNERTPPSFKTEVKATRPEDMSPART